MTTFFAFFTSNGQSDPHPVKLFGPLKQAKKTACDMLGDILERHYGRGEHTVTLYSTKYINTTTPEQFKVGFPNNMELVKDKQVFAV